MEYGWLGMIASPDLLAHPTEVLAQPDVQQRALQDAVEGFECHWPCGPDGAVCGYIAKTRRALATHCTRAHGYRV
eukprot:4008065-Amphidinium_carterae.1